MNVRALALAGLLLSGCIDTTIEATTVSLSVAGTDVGDTFDGRNGARIALTRADVAFGPLYLCSGFTAGELCDEALAQWTDAVVVDALSPDAVEVGSMEALSGTARSYMFDLGITSLLTSEEPLVSDAAASLSDASVVVEGTAEVGGQALPFEMAIRVEQGGDVEQGVPVIRSGEADGFEGALAPDGRTRLLVTFDPRPWLATARFDAFVEDALCEAGRPIVCAGSVEQGCDADGVMVESRDCATLDQVCVRELGCVERLVVEPGGQLERSLRQGVEAGERPLFELSQTL